MVMVDAVGVVRDVVFMDGFSREGRRAGWSGQLGWFRGGGWADHDR